MDKDDFKINKVRATLAPQQNIIASSIADTTNSTIRTIANDPRLQTPNIGTIDRAKLATRELSPELKQRLSTPQIDRASLSNGGITPEIKQRMVANNTTQQMDALSRANATKPLPANPAGAPSRIGEFFKVLDKPLVTQQGVANSASRAANAIGTTAKAVASSPTTGTVLRGVGRGAGVVQAGMAANDLINGNGNLLEKADSAINVGLGTATAINPIVGAPNLAYQAAKAGGSLIADFAKKLGLLDSMMPKAQAQTPQFAEAERKFLANKASAKLAQTTPQNNASNIAQTQQNTAQTGDNIGIPKLNYTDNATVKQPATPKQAGSAGTIGKAFTNPAAPAQEVAQQTGAVIENPPQNTFTQQENPLLSLSDEELANTPTLEGADSKGRFFAYPNGNKIYVPANRNPEDVVVGLDNYNKYKEFLASQGAGNNAGNQPALTSTGQQVFNPVRVINGLQDSIEGFDAQGNPIQGLASQQVVKRDAGGNPVLDGQGRPTYISDFMQQTQLTDAEKVQALKNLADIESTQIATQGRITEQGISSGASNAAINKKQALIDEYFNPSTTPERKAALAPFVIGQGTSSKGFKDVTRKNSLGEEEVFILNQDTGESKPIGGGAQSAATAKPSLAQFLTEAKKANPSVSEADLVNYYNQNYGK